MEQNRISKNSDDKNLEYGKKNRGKYGTTIW